MLSIKLLILLYKKLKPISFIFLLFLISACSFNCLYDTKTKNYIDNIYVYPVEENTGMYLTSQLKTFFPNQDINKAKYYLKTNINLEENLHLTDKFGYATQGELWITVCWQIIDKNDNKIFISSYNFIPAYYHIMPSNYATQNNKDISIQLALKFLAKNISLKIMSLIKQNNGNFLPNKENHIYNNSNTPPIYNEDNFTKD